MLTADGALDLENSGDAGRVPYSCHGYQACEAIICYKNVCFLLSYCSIRYQVHDMTQYIVRFVCVPLARRKIEMKEHVRT